MYLIRIPEMSCSTKKVNFKEALISGIGWYINAADVLQLDDELHWLYIPVGW